VSIKSLLWTNSTATGNICAVPVYLRWVEVSNPTSTAGSVEICNHLSATTGKFHNYACPANDSLFRDYGPNTLMGSALSLRNLVSALDISIGYVTCS